jgi:hypothetical protein
LPAPDTLAEVGNISARVLDRAPSLAEIGEAIGGQYWQRPMARELGKGLRTVHRWAVTGYVPSSATMRRLVDLLDEREQEIREVLARGRAMVRYFDSIR